ncbi:YjgN family protein [Novosphingobium sp.]|uniref:YjgN family protein n=1 Tax=Novosphingobium sp. TaxID=1874826 RepID=UPI0026210DD2|nr:YjgN family protein [Novosphingobium sp.]
MAEDHEYTAFEFEGRWQDYAPIAFTNLLLTIVTLGIYRFWGKARTRRYLWSRTRFIDDRLEWMGTGLELFKGAIMALLLVVLPLLLLNTLAQSLILRQQFLLGGLVAFIQITVVLLLVGVAMFRSLRYRLSRTYWRGIRGGSDDPGLRYGWSYLWKNTVGYLALGLLLPWAMVSLWNERWNGMSFGQYRFSAGGRVDGLMKRYLLCYLAPFIGFIGIVIAIAVMAATQAMSGNGNPASPGAAGIFVGFVGILSFYLIFGLVVMAYYAKFFRQMVDAMDLGPLSFQFDASTKDWLKLLLGDVGLVLVTLGIGLIFLDYRHWKFLIDHLEAFGEIDMDAISQSTTAEVRQGEGLLDAFDMGAL